jgi:hypothetical protein
MSTRILDNAKHHLLGYFRTVAARLGADAFFVPGLPRKTTSDLDEELRAAFEAWAHSGSG